MQLTNRRSRAPLAVLASPLFVLAGSGPARAATAVTSEASVWFSPGQPADNALRLIVRIRDDANPDVVPGMAERVTAYLPADVTLLGDGFPRCSLETIGQSGIEACPDGSQLGSGTVKGRLGPAGVSLEFNAFVVNGSSPGSVILYLALPNSPVTIAFEGQLLPSDDPDPAFGSMLDVSIPPELRRPGGLDHVITDIDVLLHANAGGPYVAITGCPLGTLDFKTTVAFDQAAPGAPASPLTTTASAPCLAGPPPPVNPMPRLPASPPPPPAPPPPLPPAAKPPERAVAAFGLRLKRQRGKVRKLRLTGVPAGARVSVRCLSRCGRRGAELRDSVRNGTVRLKRVLRPRSRFEVRVGGSGLVARFARYRVDRRGRTAVRTKAGCLDDGGVARACPASP
jgi:hypothetical protein